MYTQDNILCQFGPEICPQFNNSYLNQFSSILVGIVSTTAADKKRVQAIQKAERERVEANNVNLSQQGCGGGHGTGGWGGDGRGRDNQVRNCGCGRGGRDNANQANSGRGGYYVPPNVWVTMDQNQHTMLLRHRDESRHQENNHSDTTSTISEVTSPMTQPATSTRILLKPTQVP